MNNKPRLLDLFCGAGGASYGYSLAGFDVVGVDINPQPNYPFEFRRDNAIEYVFLHGNEFDAIHASPPCQRFSAMQHIHKNHHEHPDLIVPTRNLLNFWRKPYVIENVVGAPLRQDLMLCGTMFGLHISRHRIFEVNFPVTAPLTSCNHVDIYDRFHGGEEARGERQKQLDIMKIPYFMTRPEVRNAIPPVYAEYIGKQMLEFLAKH